MPRGRGLGCASGREPRVWRPPGAPGEVGRPRMMAHTPPLEANRTDALKGVTKKEGTSGGEGEDEEASVTGKSRKRSLTAPPSSIARG